MTQTRRRLLGGLAAVATVGLAGCSDEGRDTGLVAVNTQVLYGAGLPSIDYPRDVGVRVTVENTANEGRSGLLVLELSRVVETDGERTVTGSWRAQRDVDLGRGQTVGEQFVFEEVAERDDPAVTWVAEAWMVTDATPTDRA